MHKRKKERIPGKCLREEEKEEDEEDGRGGRKDKAEQRVTVVVVVAGNRPMKTVVAAAAAIVTEELTWRWRRNDSYEKEDLLDLVLLAIALILIVAWGSLRSSFACRDNC